MQQPAPMKMAMDVAEDMDEIHVRCNQKRVHELAQAFKDNGFTEVKYLILPKRADLKECGLNLGKCIKLEGLFQEEQKEPESGHGNMHHLRRMTKRNGGAAGAKPLEPGIDDDWNNEMSFNRKFRIKYTGLLHRSKYIKTLLF